MGRDRLGLWCPLEPGASPPSLEPVSCTPGDGSSRCAFGCGRPRPHVSVPCYCHPPSFVPPGAVYEQTDVHRAGWRLGDIWGDMNPGTAGLWAAWHGAGCLCPPGAPTGHPMAQRMLGTAPASSQGQRVSRAPLWLSAPGLISACTASGTYRWQKRVGFQLGPLLRLREEMERGLPRCQGWRWQRCSLLGGQAQPRPRVCSDPWSQVRDPREPPSQVLLLRHPKHPNQAAGSVPCPDIWGLDTALHWPQPLFKGCRRRLTKCTPSSASPAGDPRSAPTAPRLSQGAVQRGDPRPDRVWDSCRCFPRCITALQRPEPALGGHG